ncbi:ABC transporter substrate-binding protein [Rhodoferax sp.]|uniref:ABC transporter substrate-binding protein n=1 Tax=Rhodoferax sp. TaxID=50421 RepID=UPI00374D104E
MNRIFGTTPRRLCAALLLVASGIAQAEPGVTVTSITLGQSIYLTGGLASLGNDLNRGAGLYFDKVNAQGGINGRKVLLNTLDDAYVPARAKENAETLLDKNNVFALFQFAGTGSVAVVAPLAEARQVPLCAAVATGPELRAQRFDNVFYVRAGNTQEINAIVRLLSITARKRLGVVYLAAPYGLQGRAVAIQAAKDNNLVYAGDAEIPAGATEEVANKAADALAKQKPDAVLLITAGKTSVAAIKALQTQGFRNEQLFALAAALSPGELQTLGKAATGLVVSQITPNPDSQSQPDTVAFRKAAEKAGLTPNYALFEGWLNAAVCTTALANAGKNPTRASFRKALESVDMQNSGMRVRFSPRRRDGSTFVELTFAKEGGKFSK